MTTRVRDVMTRHPITIDPQAPIATALAVMHERQVRHLPVVDDSGWLVGMITDRDLRNATFAPAHVEYLSARMRWQLRRTSKALEDLRVADLMTWDVVTIGQDAPLAHAAALMFGGRFGSLPVVEKAKLVGILTERDVLKALAMTLSSVRGGDPDTYLW